MFTPSVNADKAVEIGKQQSKEFEEGWPDSFYTAIPRKIHPMSESSKFIAVGNSKVFDCGMLYARAMGLQSSQRENTPSIDGLLATELAPVPTSMFDDEGHMRIPVAKPQIKNDMKAECSPHYMSVSTSFFG